MRNSCLDSATNFNLKVGVQKAQYISNDEEQQGDLATQHLGFKLYNRRCL